MDYDLLNLSWEEISQLDKEELVVFLGIAPIEEHGKHLPIGVDVFETNAWINLAIKNLNQTLPKYCFCKLPTIPFGFADMGIFPGNIHVSREMIFEMTYSALTDIANWGVKNIIIISGHADPLHTIAIEQACEAINKERGLMAMAPMGSIFNCEQKGISRKSSAMIEEKRKLFPNDFHAGWIETSSMLEIAPELVNPNYKDRPDVSIKGHDMMNPHKIADLIRGEGHIGFPKQASRELGIELNNDMGEQIEKAVSSFISRSGYECT